MSGVVCLCVCVNSIIGLVLGWLGALTILYMEIKAVSLTRERDERNKLVSIRAMERANRMVELEKTEDRYQTTTT